MGQVFGDPFVPNHFGDESSHWLIMNIIDLTEIHICLLTLSAAAGDVHGRTMDYGSN
jgi:hypothetical protein